MDKLHIWIIIITVIHLLLCWGGRKSGAREGLTIISLCTLFFILLSVFYPTLKGFWQYVWGKILIIFLYAVVIYFYGLMIFIWKFPSFLKADGTEEGLIMLGADMKDGKPSSLYESRIEAAKEYLLCHPYAVMVVSGGNGSDDSITEADYAKEEITSGCIPNKQVVVENKSRTTLENLRFSRPLIEDITNRTAAQPIGVVTNGFHFFRVTRLGFTEGYSNLHMIHAKEKFIHDSPWYFREVAIVTKMFFVGPF